MLYLTIVVAVVAFLIYFFRREACCWFSNIDVLLAAVMLSFGIGILFITAGLLTDAHSYCVKISTIDTQKNPVISYLEGEKIFDNQSTITITYTTKNGKYDISPDGVINIEKNFNGKPKYVTVTKDQYYNVATLIPEIHTTFHFSEQ